MSKPRRYAGDPADFVMPGVRRYQYEDMRWYVRDCADILGLRDWTANYELEAPPLDTVRNSSLMDTSRYVLAASIDVNPYSRSFSIWLPPDWYRMATGTDEQKEIARNTVAHELLHVHFKRIDRLVEHLQTNIGDTAWATWHGIYVDENERLIEIIAESCAKALPLPNIPTKEPAKTRRTPGMQPESI